MYEVRLARRAARALAALQRREQQRIRAALVLDAVLLVHVVRFVSSSLPPST